MRFVGVGCHWQLLKILNTTKCEFFDTLGSDWGFTVKITTYKDETGSSFILRGCPLFLRLLQSFPLSFNSLTLLLRNFQSPKDHKGSESHGDSSANEVSVLDVYSESIERESSWVGNVYLSRGLFTIQCTLLVKWLLSNQRMFS